MITWSFRDSRMVGLGVWMSEGPLLVRTESHQLVSLFILNSQDEAVTVKPSTPAFVISVAETRKWKWPTWKSLQSFSLPAGLCSSPHTWFCLGFLFILVLFLSLFVLPIIYLPLCVLLVSFTIRPPLFLHLYFLLVWREEGDQLQVFTAYIAKCSTCERFKEFTCFHRGRWYQAELALWPLGADDPLPFWVNETRSWCQETFD